MQAVCGCVGVLFCEMSSQSLVQNTGKRKILLCVMLCCGGFFNIGAEGAIFFLFLSMAAPSSGGVSVGFSDFCPRKQCAALLVGYRELECFFCLAVLFPAAEILAVKDMR